MLDSRDTEKTQLTYPLVVSEMDDETGHYFFVNSPDLQGMMTHGDTLAEANDMAHDALQGWLEVWFDMSGKWPPKSDVRDWQIESNQALIYVTVEVESPRAHEAAYNKFLEEMDKAKDSKVLSLEEVKASLGIFDSPDFISSSDEEPLPLFRVQMIEDDNDTFIAEDPRLPEFIGFGDTRELALISFKEWIIAFAKLYQSDFERTIKAPNRKHQWGLAAKILMYLEIYGNVDGLVEVSGNT